MVNMLLYDRLVNDCRKISIKKNADYGNDNLKRFGAHGIVVRMFDKMDRLHNLLDKEAQVDESIEDTCKDLINYSLYLIMMQKGGLE